MSQSRTRRLSAGIPDTGDGADPDRYDHLALHRAEDFISRLLGLHAHPPLQSNRGLWLRPCKAVHTIGLGYPIDVVFLDRRFRPVRIEEHVRRNRILVCWRAHSVVELPAGFCSARQEFGAQVRRAVLQCCRNGS